MEDKKLEKMLKNPIVKLIKRVQKDYEKEEKYRKNKELKNKMVRLTMNNLIESLIDDAIKQFFSNEEDKEKIKKQREVISQYAYSILENYFK